MNQELLQKLPQSVKNIISEYNVKHRSQMRTVLNSLPVECENCQERVPKKDIIKGSVMWIDFFYCSEYCQWDHQYDIRKMMRRH